MLVDTPRFVLRDLVASDRPGFLAYQMDPRYRRQYDIADGDDNTARVLFSRILGWQQERPRRNFQVGIFERRSGRICGCTGLRQRDQEEGTAAFGIELAPDAWGRYGVAIEVASALIEHGFCRIGLRRIIGSTASGNQRVARLARWFGAEIVARRSGPEWMQARSWQEVDWALEREAWMASGRRRHLLARPDPS